MAIFERTSQNKVIVDDTEKLSCSLDSAQNIDKHTEYIIKVQRGLQREKWNVSHRYKDFAALHSSLQQASIELSLPPKKLIGNMHPSFIAERQIGLQNYMNQILKQSILALSTPVRTFLDPSNYPLNLAEQALQTVSIALRGDGKYELKGPCQDIGWRIRKHYFLVNDIENKSDYLLSWQSYGIDRYLCDKDLQAAFKTLLSLSHPYIDQILAIHNLETGAYTVRKIHEKGTIRDMLYGTDYSTNYLAKYGNPKIRKPFTSHQIAHYGNQMLQALMYLHDKGLSYGHLHPGNIAIENQRVLLMDIENVLLGVASLHRPYILENKKVNTAEAIDVYNFGRTLFEMAFAEPLDKATCDFYPDDICEDLESVLRMCLSSVSCKQQMPDLKMVALHPFFSSCRPISNGLGSGDSKPHIKLTTTLKDELTKNLNILEARVKVEQKMIRSAKREVRIQEILGSEEELRKHKRRAKRNSLWKSSSSLAETVRSNSVSTASSPTPPHACDVSINSKINSAPSAACSTSPPANGRTALLSDICGFDRTRLSRVRSQ